MPVLFILALIGCCCCVKKCCCKKSSSKGNAPAPAAQHQVSFPSGVFGVFEVRAGVFISIYLLQDRAQPSVTYSVAPATPVNRYQTVRPVAPSQPPAFSTGPSVCFKGVRELYRKTWHTPTLSSQGCTFLYFLWWNSLFFDKQWRSINVGISDLWMFWHKHSWPGVMCPFQMAAAPQPTASAAGSQLQPNFLSSDGEPTFELKGSNFSSAPLLSSNSTIADVYTSDKLNFLWTSCWTGRIGLTLGLCDVLVNFIYK